MRRAPDTPSVVAGVLVVALGLLVLLDAGDVLTLEPAYALPAVLAVAGVVLVLVGLGRGR